MVLLAPAALAKTSPLLPLEVAEWQKSSTASDMWSLGATFYEALAVNRIMSRACGLLGRGEMQLASAGCGLSLCTAEKAFPGCPSHPNTLWVCLKNATHYPPKGFSSSIPKNPQGAPRKTPHVLLVQALCLESLAGHYAADAGTSVRNATGAWAHWTWGKPSLGPLSCAVPSFPLSQVLLVPLGYLFLSSSKTWTLLLWMPPLLQTIPVCHCVLACAGMSKPAISFAASKELSQWLEGLAKTGTAAYIAAMLAALIELVLPRRRLLPQGHPQTIFSG